MDFILISNHLLLWNVVHNDFNMYGMGWKHQIRIPNNIILDAISSSDSTGIDNWWYLSINLGILKGMSFCPSLKNIFGNCRPPGILRTLLMEVARLSAAAELAAEEVDVYVRCFCRFGRGFSLQTSRFIPHNNPSCHQVGNTLWQQAFVSWDFESGRCLTADVMQLHDIACAFASGSMDPSSRACWWILSL